MPDQKMYRLKLKFIAGIPPLTPNDPNVTSGNSFGAKSRTRMKLAKVVTFRSDAKAVFTGAYFVHPVTTIMDRPFGSRTGTT